MRWYKKPCSFPLYNRAVGCLQKTIRYYKSALKPVLLRIAKNQLAEEAILRTSERILHRLLLRITFCAFSVLSNHSYGRHHLLGKFSIPAIMPAFFNCSRNGWLTGQSKTREPVVQRAIFSTAQRAISSAFKITFNLSVFHNQITVSQM